MFVGFSKSPRDDRGTCSEYEDQDTEDKSKQEQGVGTLSDYIFSETPNAILVSPNIEPNNNKRKVSDLDETSIIPLNADHLLLEQVLLLVPAVVSVTPPEPTSKAIKKNKPSTETTIVVSPTVKKKKKDTKKEILPEEKKKTVRRMLWSKPSVHLFVLVSKGVPLSLV
jgi:hypothetical protein